MPVDKPTLSERFNLVVEALDRTEFEIPRGQGQTDDDFPIYLKKQLDQYIAHYKKVLMPLIEDEDGMPFGEDSELPLPMLQESLLEPINPLSNGRIRAVNFYYEGRLLQANEAFREALNDVRFPWLTTISTSQNGRDFYRTRSSSDRRLTKQELFHNPFENRGNAATSRYSIPGLPALYLGDSTYVCWEESRRKKMDNLYFSRFRNTEPIRLVQIQRIDDLLNTMDAVGAANYHRLSFLVRYLRLFPLCIACSIKTKSDNDIFKPEYIIPQLLLQYVTTEKEVAGIMFPSTRVDYSKINRVPAYNYVFPVKQSQSRGFCSALKQIFQLTEPTSLELENLMSYSSVKSLPLEAFMDRRTLTMVEGVPEPYATTAFGFLEQVMAGRELGHLPD